MGSGFRIKIIGDSLASGMGTSKSTVSDAIVCSIDEQAFFRRNGGHGWAQLLQRDYPHLEILNNACDGITSSEVVKCWNQLYDCSDSLVLILLGANDRKEPDGMKRLENNLLLIAERCKANGSTVIFLTPHPSTKENEALPSRLYRMRDVAEVINRVGKKTSSLVIDLYYRLSSSEYDIEAIMHGGDGNHSTDEMARLEYRIILETLSNILKEKSYE